MTEIWKEVTWIEGYNGYYMVSNKGRVKSLARPAHNKYGEAKGIRSERILKPSHCRKYLTVKFCAHKKEKTLLIHRLVARAFIALPQKYINLGLSFDNLEVNHIDGNPSNNFVDNLEWCTKDENMKHAIEQHLIVSGRKGGLSARAKKVAMYDLEGNLLKVFPSVVDAAAFFGSTKGSHIASVCRGNRYTSFCHIFRYVTDEKAVETKIFVPELPKFSLDQIKRKEYDTFRSAGQVLLNKSLKR